MDDVQNVLHAAPHHGTAHGPQQQQQQQQKKKKTGVSGTLLRNLNKLRLNPAVHILPDMWPA